MATSMFGNMSHESFCAKADALLLATCLAQQGFELDQTDMPESMIQLLATGKNLAEGLTKPVFKETDNLVDARVGQTANVVDARARFRPS